MLEMIAPAIVNLPKLRPEEYVEQNTTARQLAGKTRDLRLRALQCAPDEFASIYEVELARGLGQTLERLRNSQTDHFFAVEHHNDLRTTEEYQDTIQKLLQAKWVGMIVLIGPQDGTSSVSARSDPLTQRCCSNEAQISEASRHRTLRYHLNGTFVEPAARGRDLGKALIEAALEKARTECLRQCASFHCSILVDSKNSAARGLYEKVGFVACGEEPYVQMRPSKADESLDTERVAVRMEIR